MKNNETKMKHKFSPFYCVLGIVIGLYSVTIISSIYFMFVTAFKTQPEFRANPLWLPGMGRGIAGLTFNNITEVFTCCLKANGIFVFVPEMIYNSIIYSFGTAFFATLVPCVMAYFAAKFEYKFSGVIYAIVVAVMIIPVVGTMPATIRMLKNTGLYNKLVSAFVLKGNFVNMYFLVFYASFKGVPKDYTEAAYVDGASELRIMVNVIMPLIRNAFFTILLIFFVDFWNDYQTPLLYIPAKPTIARYIRTLSTDMVNVYKGATIGTGSPQAPAKGSMQLQMAGCLIMAVPTLTIFCLFRNKLMGNLSMGGIKG